MDNTGSRRGFVSGSAAAGLGMLILKPETVRGSQANSALTLGLIGAGNRGSYVAGIFAKNEFCKVTAVADIYEDKLKAATAPGKFSTAKTFRSAKELIASDVDAVYIATPPYLHPEHFELAVAAKKHIFMEKPAGVDVPGCMRVLAASKKADKTKRISLDFQQRYGADYRQAWDRLKKGEFGAIKMVRASWIGGGLPLASGHPADQEKVRNWLYYREHSGDIIVEQNCHNLDVVNWFMNTHPTKVSGYGARAVRKAPGNIMDSLGLTYEFADGTVFSYSASQFTAGGYTDISETFFCEKGTVRTHRKGYEVYNKPQRGAPPEVVQTASSKGDITEDAVNAFVLGARTGDIENAAPWAVESTLTAILGREAIYSGKPMTWADLKVQL
ncbi:MAG TPA: Gfo/Idh/MocA family oxidoreductase [Bryobacteraceae bacterium]|nr:Gfo/Idh/MocA family oxidoreductase [Bryobacteraceae bacterium]